MQRLLELNLAQARLHGATYAIEASTGAVAYYLRRAPARVDANGLRQELSRVAQLAQRWRADRLLGPLPKVSGPADAEGAGRWPSFA